MAGAAEVTREMLRPLFEDNSVLGVIGMNRTTSETTEAIRLLGDEGIPVLATTLTAAALVEVSPLYFQLVPGHEKQAKLVWDYAVERIKASSLVIYKQKDADSEYIKGLVEALKAMAPPELTPDTVEWKKVSEINPECKDTHITFYAGLGDHFQPFLDRLAEKCSDVDQRPEIVGSDATARLFTSSKTRQLIPSGLKVSYVSLGAPAALAGPQCVREGTPPVPLQKLGELLTFCDWYRRLSDEVGRDLDPSGIERPTERMAVAYDAMGLFRKAVSNNRGIDRGDDTYIPNRSAIAAELRELNYNGVTGSFNFGDGNRSTDDSNSDDRVANDRAIAILGFKKSNVTLPDKPICPFWLKQAPDNVDNEKLCQRAT
jgi:hypothetical protein